MLWSGSGLCCTLRWWQLNLLASHPCVKQLNQNTSKSVSNHFLSESKDLLSSQRNDLCLESSCCIWLRSTSLQSRGREGNKYERPLCGYHLKDRLFGATWHWATESLPISCWSDVLIYSTGPGPALMTFYATNCTSKYILILGIFVLLQPPLLFTLPGPFNLLTKGS